MMAANEVFDGSKQYLISLIFCMSPLSDKEINDLLSTISSEMSPEHNDEFPTNDGRFYFISPPRGTSPLGHPKIKSCFLSTGQVGLKGPNGTFFQKKKKIGFVPPPCTF